MNVEITPAHQLPILGSRYLYW